MLSRSLSLLVVFATSLAADPPPDPSTEWTPELSLQVKRIANVRVSPDGTMAAFDVATARMDETNSDYLTHVHVADADGSWSFQLTRGDASCSGARWSPDGQWLAFTSTRGGEKDNLFRIRVRGGEAERLTDVETGVSSFRWSPDGTRIAFLMSDAPTEDETARQEEKNDARVVDEDLKATHLHLVPIEPGEEGDREIERITGGDFSIGGGFGDAFSWSPDGTTIAFSHTVTPKIDDWPTADISVVSVAGGEVTALVATRAAETNPVFSPDGRTIAYAASDDPPTWGFSSYVHLVDAGGGTPRALARTPGEQPQILGFLPGRDAVLVNEFERTGYQVYRLPLLARSGPLPVGNRDMYQGPSLNRSGTHLGFVKESTTQPPEAHVSGVDTIAPRRVSRVQDLPDLPIGRTEVLTWRSSDGTEIEGLLTYPVDHGDDSRPAPLLVIVHGGPTGVFQQRFIGARGAYPIAAFAARGYAVLRCNPRGSSGYGRAFRYANYGDWGGGDYRDIMTGVDHVIGLGVADPDRMGIMGWSYGGFMTSWAITQTDRFRAASVGAGVTNLMSFTGTADIPSFIPDYFEGEFWERLDAWAGHSAMFNIESARTPTLIQHGEADARVPVTQGYELYNALRRMNVPTKMVVYPRQPHGIREPRLQLDAMHRNLDWFDEWVRGTLRP